MQGGRVRVGAQAAREFFAASRVQLAVDIGVDQLDQALGGHQAIPPATSTSRRAWRAVNSRDLTVLTGQSRISAMSS